MAGKNYDIDDILKEIDSNRRRGEDDFDESAPAPEAPVEKVADIIGENSVDRLVLAGTQKKAKKEKERAGRQKKPDLSVTQILTGIPDTRDKSVARQLTEEQSEARIAKDISAAADKRQPVSPAEENEPFAARQLTEEQSEARIAKDISDAADVKIYRKNMVAPFDPDIADTAEADAFSAHSMPFEKPAVSGETEDIIFHTRGDLVTTETMEMRKQQKINEINKALLKADSEAHSPEDMLDSINPMVSKQKVEEMMKGDGSDDTDTLAVAGNDLKRIAHGGEHVREYQPAAKKKDADDVLFSAAGKQNAPIVGELHVGETIVDALNKKIAEENRQKFALFTSELPPVDETASGTISKLLSVQEQEEPEPEENEKVKKIKAANEMAQKRKRKIANFILENPENSEEEELAALDDEENEEQTDEPIDLDDENIIRDRLSRATKGLISRLIILGALFGITLFIAIANAASPFSMPFNNIISIKAAAENYLYTHLTIGILSFAACSSVITNGFSRLFRGKPDNDTLCAFAHTGALIALIPYLISKEFINLGYSHVYLLLSLGLLCFNTISKLITIKTAKKNFAFVSGEGAKFFIERCDRDGSEQLAKGAVSGIPVIASMRKTEMLYDFIVSTYCEDASDRVSGKASVVSLIAALIGGIVAFFIDDGLRNNINPAIIPNIPWSTIAMNKLSWAVTVMSAILCLGAAFSCSMIVTLPLLISSIKGKSQKFAVLGYGAVEKFCETNSVLLEAKTLFPPSSIKITNICGYDKPRNRGEGRVNVDEAIIYAASLAVQSDSVMADAFFNMLGYKEELLKPVNGIVYENNLGVMGWIDRRRVLLGNRAHMKSHEITVPNMKKEMAANIHNDEVIYLAVGGEVCLLFFAAVSADKQTRDSVDELARRGVSLIIKTVDGMITSSLVSDLFDLDEKTVKIIPFDNHEMFNEHTKFTSRGSAALCCRGTLSSFTGAVCATKSLRLRVSIGCVLQIFGEGLGILLAFIFMFFSKHEIFGELYLLLFNTACMVLTLGVQLSGELFIKLFGKKKKEEPEPPVKPAAPPQQ